VIDWQSFAHRARKRVNADDDRQAERKREEPGSGSHAQHSNDEQQQQQQLQRLKTAERKVVMTAGCVIHHLDERAAERTKVRAVVELRSGDLPQRAAADGRELGERVAELHRDLEQQRTHHRGNRRRVGEGKAMIVTTGFCAQWDRGEPECT
jgi:hypothetical protein